MSLRALAPINAVPKLTPADNKLGVSSPGAPTVAREGLDGLGEGLGLGVGLDDDLIGGLLLGILHYPVK